MDIEEFNEIDSMKNQGESKNILMAEDMPPPSFLKLRAAFEEICELLDAESTEDKTIKRTREDFIKDFKRAFESHCWAWEPITTLMEDEKIDRLGEVVMGPIFTSKDHPWPEEGGFPMAPLIQLNLENASKLGSVNLGEGLLQVWMPHKAVTKPLFIRVVPRQLISTDKLTPLIEIPADMDPLQIREETWNFDLEKSEPSLAIQIIGYSPKRPTTQFRFPIQDNYFLKNLTKNKEAEKCIKDFDKLIKPLLKKGPKGFRPSGCHLFGTFEPIQYYADERPRPLFCFDSDYMGFMWGDGGNAQLFYSINLDGQVEFSFEWSCT